MTPDVRRRPTPGGPYLVVRSSERRLIADVEYGTDQTIVRKLRGKKCRNYDSFMGEIGAALQFFYGFGENWSAVGELLREMDEWLPGDGYVFVIEHAEELFADEPVEFNTFVRILHRVGDWWAQPIVEQGRFDRPARPFRVILESADPGLMARLEATGCDLALWD